MVITTLVKPISCAKLKNLQVTEYVLLYLDKDNRLKRAIPDFEESFVSYDDSLILEAIKAERLAPFKFVRYGKQEQAPVFDIKINETGEVVGYSNFIGNETKLENFLLDSTRRRNVARLLQKTR